MAWAFERFNNGAHNDLIEGVVIWAAAALMLYVSGWLFVRSDPRAWQAYLQAQADHALSQRTGIAIAALAFLSVFREGAETVLFIHALAKTSGGWSGALIGGLIFAAFALVVLFFVINGLAKRLPLRPVFMITSAFLFFMAIKFIGEGMQEFQEQQFVSFTPVPGANWLLEIGFNPTWEAIIAQLIVVAIAIGTVLVVSRQSRVEKASAKQIPKVAAFPKRSRHVKAERPASPPAACHSKLVRASHRGSDPLLQLLLRCGADLPRGHLAVLEDHQRRDRHDAVLRGGLRILVDVELQDLDLVAERARDFLERRRDHPARTAPFGPEIHHDRAGRLQYLGLESGVRNLVHGHGDTSFSALFRYCRNAVPEHSVPETYEAPRAASSGVTQG